MFNLDGKTFSPFQNSEGGRVASDAIFIFKQSDDRFTATYSGSGFSDGHLIGQMEADGWAVLIYHCRADDGTLEAGEAKAVFEETLSGKLKICMKWKWLNGSRQSGTSYYGEI